MRYIDDAKFFIQKDLWGNDLLVFQIEANAFLWKMVRTLTGTLINLDKSKAPLDSMEKILQAIIRPLPLRKISFSKVFLEIGQVILSFDQ